MHKDIETELQLTTKDKGHIAAKAVLSAVPWLGGPIATLFEAICAQPLSKRRDEWMISIYEELRELKDRFENVEPEHLSENPGFVTTLMHASQIALRNHQEEKLTVLRNAVLNAALPNSPDENKQQLFLAIVDYITVWHIQILRHLANPIDYWTKRRGVKFRPDSTAIPDDIIPELSNQQDIFKQLVTDLDSRGLLYSESLHSAIKPREMQAKITPLGIEFLDFIKHP